MLAKHKRGFLVQNWIFTFVHQQTTLLCFLLVPLVVGEKHHLESICVGCSQVLAVPFGCHTDCTVVTVIGTLSWFTFNKRVSGTTEIIRIDVLE